MKLAKGRGGWRAKANGGSNVNITKKVRDMWR